MRGALIHGVLLVVMLVYGYRTWTRDKSNEPNVGSVVLWDRSEADLVSIEYKADRKIVKIERKGQGPEAYWWGSDTTIDKRPKPQPPKPDQGSGSAGSGSAGSAAGSGSAGSAAGSGSAGSGSAGSAPPPPPVEEEEVGRKTHEFPLGETGDKVVKAFTTARAMSDLGKLSDAKRKEYKLDDAKQTTITVTFKDGARTFLVGGAVYGGADKYAVDQQSGRAYVMSREMISGLETGESSLHLVDPRGFDAAKIDQVVIEAGGRTKTVARVTQAGASEGQQVKTWGDPETKKGNQTVANFVDNANNLRPTEYAAALKVSDLTPVLKLTYKDDKGALLGVMSLYKHEKPGELPEGQELDPANPPKGEIEYLIMTEKTRVPAIVRKDTAERMENDIETVFSNKPPEDTTPTKPIPPPGKNPFGQGPLPPPIHGGSGSPAPSPAPPPVPPAPVHPGGPESKAMPPHGSAAPPAPAPTPPANPGSAATPPAKKP